jgi:hypothetical protein
VTRTASADDGRPIQAAAAEDRSMERFEMNALEAFECPEVAAGSRSIVSLSLSLSRSRSTDPPRRPTRAFSISPSASRKVAPLSTAHTGAPTARDKRRPSANPRIDCPTSNATDLDLTRNLPSARISRATRPGSLRMAPCETVTNRSPNSPR